MNANQNQFKSKNGKSMIGGWLVSGATAAAAARASVSWRSEPPPPN